MPIKKWHPGKIALLWVWGLVLIWLALRALGKTPSAADNLLGMLSGITLIAAIIGIPVILSVVTWKWLSGKEQN